jgi:hypothetical protein
MAFFSPMQLFVWIACERSHASFAQAHRKHKLPCREEKQRAAGCLRRNIDSILRIFEPVCVVGGHSPCC